MKVAIEYDDFSPVNSNFGVLESFKETYPDFKVTMFTVPWEIRFSELPPSGGRVSMANVKHACRVTDPKYRKWVEAVNDCDWIEVALHGLFHSPLEFAELSYDHAKKAILTGMKMFESVGIKNFTPIFKAPQWAISPAAKMAAEDLGFTVLENGYYNWNLANDVPNADAVEPYIMHGHIQDVCENGLVETQMVVRSLPTDTEFLFLSDIYKTKKGIYEY